MQQIRNIAIIAHVDHGKTTLVDCLLRQSGTFRTNQAVEERVMDSMDLEREKGITIRAKNAAFKYKGCHVNIVDTPGHADFGGEVERILNMIDGVLLVVDAVEGPQAQTRFVLRKALEVGAKPIVVINKIDREFANPSKVLDQVFDLFVALNASNEQLDFPVIYASAKDGYAVDNLEDITNPKTEVERNIIPLFEAIIKYVPSPKIEHEDDFKLLVSNLDYSDYLGRIAFGKILSGKVSVGDTICCIHGDGSRVSSRITSIFNHKGLERIQLEKAFAGDIIGLSGFEEISIGETLVSNEDADPLPFKPIDPPTIKMQFAVNDGPLAGKEGQLVTARHIRERLAREIRTNISLKVEDGETASVFDVSGRGEMHIAVLVEQMRREGYEVLVSRPEVILRRGENAELLEPIERLFLEIPKDSMGTVLENLSNRKADIQDISHHGDMISIEALIPTRGLIGFETDLVNQTRGMGVISHLFHGYEKYRGDVITRKNGSLVSMESGIATSYALNMIQERGRLMVEPGDEIYEGMIVGENAREQDIPVNPCKTKKLTNMRSSGDGKGIQLEPPMRLSLERALEYIGQDEYVEATPKHLRLRKKILDATQRKRASLSGVHLHVEGE